MEATEAATEKAMIMGKIMQQELTHRAIKQQRAQVLARSLSLFQ